MKETFNAIYQSVPNLSFLITNAFFWAFDSSKNVMRLLIISYIFLGGGSLFGGGGASNAPTFGSVASQPAGGTFGAIAQQGKVEIFLEQREVVFLLPSKICGNLNFSTVHL